RGADVKLVSGPANVAAPSGMSEIASVRSAAEMHSAVMAWRDWADVIVMAAAVADYTPAAGAAAGKMAKGGDVDLPLARTKDILLDLGTSRGESRKPVLVGFAAETGDAVE